MHALLWICRRRCHVIKPKPNITTWHFYAIKFGKRIAYILEIISANFHALLCPFGGVVDVRVIARIFGGAEACKPAPRGYPVFILFLLPPKKVFSSFGRDHLRDADPSRQGRHLSPHS
jgi:hypothetical protein